MMVWDEKAALIFIWWSAVVWKRVWCDQLDHIKPRKMVTDRSCWWCSWLAAVTFAVHLYGGLRNIAIVTLAIYTPSYTKLLQTVQALPPLSTNAVNEIFFQTMAYSFGLLVCFYAAHVGDMEKSCGSSSPLLRTLGLLLIGFGVPWAAELVWTHTHWEIQPLFLCRNCNEIVRGLLTVHDEKYRMFSSCYVVFVILTLMVADQSSIRLPIRCIRTWQSVWCAICWRWVCVLESTYKHIARL